MERRSALPRLLSLCLGSALALTNASAADGEMPRNPFQPANSASAPAAAANESIEFAGVSQMGKMTHLIIHDKTAKKNRWVPLGETVEGISAVRYDPRLEQAVIKVNGSEKTLSLRKGTGPVNTPQPVAPLPAAAGFSVAAPPLAQSAQILPAATNTLDPSQPQPQPVANKPAGPATPETQARQETEARMLVSDLLEIGMAQRRAYEEAQRRAAEGKSQPAAPDPNAPAQPKQ